MHVSMMSFAILMASGKFVEAKISHLVIASMIESGSLASACACFSNDAELPIPSVSDQPEYLDGAVAKDAFDIVSETEMDAVAKLRLEAPESLDSRSASMYPNVLDSEGLKYGDVGESEALPG